MKNLIKAEQITEGLRKSFNNENCKMANRECYGYEIGTDDELTIKSNEAKVVKFIFEQYLSGNSFGAIVKKLEKENIASPTGKSKWNREAISKILSNEKYVGSVLLQKTVSLCGVQITNIELLDKYLITGHHESIVSAEIFEQVQFMKKSRSKQQMQNNSDMVLQ